MRRDIREYRLYEAIQRQPEELERLLHADEPIEAAAERFRGARRVFTVGLGTSFHAAMVAASLLRAAEVDARAWSSADFVLYPPPRLSGEDALLLFTHTGGKRFSRAALERLGELDTRAVVITSSESSLAAEGFPRALFLRTVSREQSAMHTVSYTSAMLLAARIAEALRPGVAGSLSEVPRAVRMLLDEEDEVAAHARDWHERSTIVAIGGGPQEPTALESAIKIAEAARRPVRAHASEQFLHGPQVQLAPGDDVVLAFATPGRALERTEAAARFALTVGCEVAWVAPAPGPDGSRHIAAPDVGELLAPIVQVAVPQLLAGHLAALAGVDGDNFRRDDPRFAAAREALEL